MFFLYPQKFYFTEYKIFPVPILVHLLKVSPLVLKKLACNFFLWIKFTFRESSSKSCKDVGCCYSRIIRHGNRFDIVSVGLALGVVDAGP